MGGGGTWRGLLRYDLSRCMAELVLFVACVSNVGKENEIACLVEALLAFGFGLVGRVEGWVSSCNGFCEKGWVGSIK